MYIGSVKDYVKIGFLGYKETGACITFLLIWNLMISPRKVTQSSSWASEVLDRSLRYAKALSK